VFLSSHLLAEVEQIASHVAIIGRGRQLFEGTLDDLKSRQRARVVVEVDQPAIACSLLRDAGWTVEQVDEPAVRITVNSRTAGNACSFSPVLHTRPAKQRPAAR
jgi:ABC-2 type transport system ATP-binding protein